MPICMVNYYNAKRTVVSPSLSPIWSPQIHCSIYNNTIYWHTYRIDAHAWTMLMGLTELSCEGGGSSLPAIVPDVLASQGHMSVSQFSGWSSSLRQAEFLRWSYAYLEEGHQRSVVCFYRSRLKPVFASQKNQEKQNPDNLHFNHLRLLFN